MPGKRRLTSWERRRLLRIKRTVYAVFFSVILLIVFMVVRMFLPYGSLKLSDYVSYTYEGYNNNASIILSRDEEGLGEFLDEIRQKHDHRIIHVRKSEASDYEAFLDSISYMSSTSGKLSNGSRVSYSCSYDRELADKLRIHIKDKDGQILVSGLPTVAILKSSELFDDISIKCSGVSPNITVEVVNESPIPLIKNMNIHPVAEQEFYKEGDIVTLMAEFTESECLSQHYAIDALPSECTKDYTVTGDGTYATSAAQLPSWLIDEAIEAGKGAFNDANEFGVRVYIEAGLVPVYINKKATFQWLSPSLLSVYFKSAMDGVGGKSGNNYNMLDIVYNCTMTQADGVTCKTEAVVRFTDIIVYADGSFDYDFSDPKVISASHNNSSIKKVVIGKYESDFEIEKIR